MNTNQIKILFVGDSKVGKTVYLNRLLTGEFTRKYDPTMIDTSDCHKLTFKTNHCIYAVDCIDHSGLLTHHFVPIKDADAAVVMFDVTRRETYENVDEWVNYLRREKPDLPIILCGNKVDCRKWEVRPEETTKQRDLKLSKFFYISAKSNYQFEKPFLHIMRIVSNKPDTHIIV